MTPSQEQVSKQGTAPYALPVPVPLQSENSEPQTQTPHKKDNETQMSSGEKESLIPTRKRQATDTQHYDHDTVVLLFSMMKAAGYGDRKAQKESLKEVFAEVVHLAEKNHGIKRTAEGWQKKFMRIKQDYSLFLTKLKQCGHSVDAEDIFNTPEFFEQIHELENGKAHYDPPENYTTDEGSSGVDTQSTSSRKRMKISKDSILSDFMKKQEETNHCIIAELQKSNEERQKIRTLLERLVEKF